MRCSRAAVRPKCPVVVIGVDDESDIKRSSSDEPMPLCFFTSLIFEKSTGPRGRLPIPDSSSGCKRAAFQCITARARERTHAQWTEKEKRHDSSQNGQHLGSRL